MQSVSVVPSTPWGKFLAKKIGPRTMRDDAAWLDRCKAAERSGHGIILHAKKGLEHTYGMILEGDQIVLKDRKMPLTGAWATVDSAGELRRQFSPGGLLALGILGATKKVDNREVYFAVSTESDGVAWCVQGRDQAKARAFAMKINTSANGHRPTGCEPTSPAQLRAV